MKDVILTPEGYKQLKAELDVLRTEKRREIAERIAAAREFGEIAENAEYDDAKNEQAMLEHKIAQLEENTSEWNEVDRTSDHSGESDNASGQVLGEDGRGQQGGGAGHGQGVSGGRHRLVVLLR